MNRLDELEALYAKAMESLDWPDFEAAMPAAFPKLARVARAAQRYWELNDIETTDELRAALKALNEEGE